MRTAAPTQPLSPASVAPRAPRLDVTAYLTVWAVLLFGISAHQVIGPLGSLGSPALLLLLPAVLWWFSMGRPVDTAQHPCVRALRVIVLVYAWYMLASYAVALARPITALESSGSTRAAIMTLGLCGLSLLVIDGIQSTERLFTLLRRVVLLGGFMSAVGILQFVAGDLFQPTIPGLQWLHEADVSGRSIFHRPSGTALHSIEFSVVTAALLPLGAHFSLYLPPGGKRQLTVLATILTALAVPLALSRSGILALVVALGVLFAGWSGRRRLNGLFLLLASVPVLWVTVPGLVGTIRSLFTWWGTDPSIQARIDRVPAIIRQFNQRPWFGLGNGTWSIQDYFLLDNEVYVTTLETGIVGLLLTTALFGTAFVTGLWAAHVRGATGETANLGRAIAAGIAAIGVSLFTFDAFYYRILTGVLFLFIGGTAALVRLTHRPASEARWSPSRRVRGGDDPRRPVRRRGADRTTPEGG